MTSTLFSLYRRLVLAHPGRTLALLIVLLVFSAWQARHFTLDASADSLLLESDPDYLVFSDVQARYSQQSPLIITFTPKTGDVFDEPALATLRTLRKRLREIPGVASVFCLLDVPLVGSAQGLTGLASIAARGLRTLDDPEVDRASARKELLESPYFSEYVISADARTTAISIILKSDAAHTEAIAERDRLRLAESQRSLSSAERADLARIEEIVDRGNRRSAKERRDRIATIRGLLDEFENAGEIHLGGVPMIVDDMITFIRNDLVVFGVGVALFIASMLGLIFRSWRWIALPLSGCIISGLVMIGGLGFAGLKVTVISSNFLALMLIIALSMHIHLAVRYRQLHRDRPDASHRELVEQTVRRMAKPCLYAALTTIIGFASLVFSDIKPVIDFGLMMSAGLLVSFAVAFTAFPALLLWIGKSPEPSSTATVGSRLTHDLARIAKRYRKATIPIAGGLFALSIIGALRLDVENSFVDYFGENTDIHRGLSLIDRELGGTTPLEILLDLDEGRIFDDEPSPRPQNAEEKAAKATYWFTGFKIDRIKEVHDWLAKQEGVGKVHSLASLIRVLEKVNGEKPFGDLELALIYKMAPDEIKGLIDDYVDVSQDEARIVLRIEDTAPDLKRRELLERIETGLALEFELGPRDVTISGLMVLYNNMLQSLFVSQIASLGAVLIGVGLMLLALFRSPTIALLGLLPNLLAAGAVLGTMGFLSIPLDLMTITVAAITIGIAVDNAIHYLYRFREEFARGGDYTKALYISHGNIGRAVFYNSAAIVFGFSILLLSNFLPTIHFGLLTGLAMGIALIATLTLLPSLILLLKPFGPQRKVAAE
ncbi:efflux RND transporter permease subunit [Thioalkalivibrio sp. HK1]|uniref:efflux RND transporter permease subunit n=1 Tax=Thioalkalivibrio sp. HK1 TaxID=1469245 RepID=UPI00056FC649|nr:MMPL family transporter [Thioalkalivibrio sp. HK1]